MVRKMKGFTLVEVIVAIVILAIALAIAIPFFNKYKKSFEITSQFNQIESDLNYAKAYAFTRKVKVSVKFISANSYQIVYKDNNTIIKGPINLKYPCLTNAADNTITFLPPGYPTPASISSIHTPEANSVNCTDVSFARIISGVYIGTSQSCTPFTP